jgi:hypothetical protein
MSAETVDEYFAGKPESHRIFDAIAARIAEHGPTELSVRSQISFGVSRKFAWFWLYNVSKKNPSGVPHLMLAADHEMEDPHIREVNQISTKRWNHQIVVRSLDDARSAWLGELIAAAYRYGGRQR